jgi:hypothetical protein
MATKKKDPKFEVDVVLTPTALARVKALTRAFHILGKACDETRRSVCQLNNALAEFRPEPWHRRLVTWLKGRVHL